MGRLIRLLKDVIADSTQNTNQSRQGRRSGQNDQDDYDRDFDDGRPGPVYRGDNSGRRKSPLPPPYEPPYDDYNSSVDYQSSEDYDSRQSGSRLPGPAPQVPNELPLEKRLARPSLSDQDQANGCPPRPRGGRDGTTPPPGRMSGQNSSAPTSYGSSPRDASFRDPRYDPNYSMRGYEAQTLRGSAPQRQRQPEYSTDKGPDMHYYQGSRRERRRARRSERRGSNGTGRGGLVSLLKDSM